jgi:hypothetical protein
MDRFEYWLMLFSLYQAGAPGTSLKAHQMALHKSYGPTCLCLNLKKSPPNFNGALSGALLGYIPGAFGHYTGLKLHQFI